MVYDIFETIVSNKYGFHRILLHITKERERLGKNKFKIYILFQWNNNQKFAMTCLV